MPNKTIESILRAIDVSAMTLSEWIDSCDDHESVMIHKLSNGAVVLQRKSDNRTYLVTEGERMDTKNCTMCSKEFLTDADGVELKDRWVCRGCAFRIWHIQSAWLNEERKKNGLPPATTI